MSRYIATRAIRGANLITQEAEELLNKAIAEKGPDCAVAFPNTAYYLPTIFGMTGRQCQTTIANGKVLMQDRVLVLQPQASTQGWLSKDAFETARLHAWKFTLTPGNEAWRLRGRMPKEQSAIVLLPALMPE